MSNIPGPGSATQIISFAVAVRDLRPADLAGLGWAGSRTHLASVAAVLDRVAVGEALEYLAVCGPADIPLGVGCLDFTRRPGAGEVSQLAVHPAVQSCGLGTVLIRAAEQRIAARGLDRAELAVESARARRLYERLGYHAYGTETVSWPVDSGLYTTEVTLMRRTLR
jgi:ribosomal protein S18 acetylase RimI-like enzyme